MAEVTDEKKRISELQETTDFTGLYTIASKSVGSGQQSFKVSLEGVKNATNAANTAASNATTAASNANAKAALAEEKATLAATKAAAADSAATAANSAASAANTAAGSATSAAEEAEDAASAASAAADRVDEVIETANADHEQAATDHETAVADHEQAEADHEEIERKSDKDGYTPSQRVGSADDVVLGERAWSEEEILFRRSGCPYERGNAVVRGAKGRSMAWNQLVVNGNFAQGVQYWTPNKGTITANGGILTYTVVTPDNSQSLVEGNFPDIANHKYLFAAELNYSANPADANTGFLGIGGYYGVNWPTANIVPNSWFKVAGIVTSTGVSPYKDLRVYFRTRYLSAGDTIQIKNVVAFDLTLLYGAGKEPTSVAEFERTFPNLYYPFNAGKLIHNAANRIESVGRNVWDEEWESGTLNNTTGEEASSTTDIRSKNYIPVIAEEYYYFKSEAQVQAYGYDASHNFIGRIHETAYNLANTKIQIPAGCSYIRLRIVATTYNHDVCINRSDSHNGLYTPYEKSVATIRLDAFKVKDANGNVLTVNGLKGAGTVFDERDDVRRKYIKRVGTVDLGTLDWTYDSVNGNMYSQTIPSKAYSTAEIPNMVCANYIVVAVNSLVNKSLGSASYRVYVKDSAYTDAATFKAAMSGVELNYELAIPVEYDLVDDINGYYKATSLGTEASAPLTDATGDPISLPFTGELGYGQTIGEQMDDKTGQNDYAPALVAGSADGLLGVSKAQEFTFAAVPEGTGNGAARIGKVKGNSLAWNQLVDELNTMTIPGLTITLGPNGYIKIDGTCSASSTRTTISGVGYLAGHKILLYSSKALPENSSWSSAYNADRRQKFITTLPDSFNGAFSFYCDANVTFNNFECYYHIIDLTLMFGAGKEPSTVADFEALYPEPYYPYNAGAISNNTADTLVTDGFQQWDEEWELGGIDSTTGANITDNTRIRSKNYIPVFSTIQYHCYDGGAGGINVRFYDGNKVCLGTAGISNIANETFTIPANASFLRFTTYSYGTTYKNDICINRSDPARNGKYEPHWRRTLHLALTSLRGRLNGTGERVAIFPDGMKRAGDAYDEVYGNIAIKRVVSVDLGTLTWTDYETGVTRTQATLPSQSVAVGRYVKANLICDKYVTYPYSERGSSDRTICLHHTQSSDIWVNDSSFDGKTGEQIKAAMNGVMLNYELATPEIYILDEPIPSGFAVGAGGTMHALPDAIDGTPTAPFAADIAFPRDNYGITSKNSTVALLEALKTAGKIASYTIGYDANGDMTFNIT